MALDTILNITANTRPAEQQIDRLTSRNYGIKLNIDSQPLGRITGQLSEFNKSMDAANARVVAFGASAGAIMVLEKSFRAMIDSTIEVEKSLKDIQVVLDVSGESMAKFGKGLFDIAKNTGQSFSVAAEAATEFSRQGLSMEDTLKRTSDALILSRLSGLGAAESVNVLTAAVNSFANQGVTATEVVNKLATVDAAFAVSSKDLAEGISRVGASASQSGVSIDELIGLITSAQQATARGGAVIGNSFKTIFTRLERGKTQSLLESLGVDTKDDSGRIKSTVDMLRDLAKVYGTLGQGQQADVAEKVGGVFQINILKAALADLGKEHSVYAGAVDISNNATDEATKRNEKLNETYAAQINRLQQGATQLAAAAGKRVLGPSMDRVIGTGNGILDNLNNIDSSSIGAKLGKGLLDGIGQVIAGPGLVLIGGVIIKLLGDFSKFAGGSVKELLGLNAASKEQAAIQSSITKMLERNPALLAQINSEAKTQSDQAKILLDFYMKQTAEMQKQAALTGQLASKLYTGGVRMGTDGVPVAKKAAGYIPEFASEEAQARMLGAHNPRAEWSKGTIGGQRFIKNSEETEIVGFGSNGDSAVIPHYAKGYIPNFAEKRAAKRRSAQKQAELETKAKNKELKKQSGEPIDLGDQDRIGLIYSTRGATVHRERGSFTTRDGQQYTASIWAAGPQLPLAVKKDEGDISKVIDSALRGATNAYIKTLGGSSGLPTHEMKEGDKFSNSGAISAAIGTAFETAITRLTDEGMREGGETARIDFSSPSGKLRNLFDNIKSEQLEAKYSNNPKLVSSTLIKGYEEGLLSGTKTRKAASGYIPNFADALQESIAREISAGVPANEVYVKQYSQLASQNNPEGYGVFNRRDEGSMSKEMTAMRNKGYAKGYIPNFADEGSGQGSSAAALGVTGFADMVMMFTLMKRSSGEATSALREEFATKKSILSQEIAINNELIQSETKKLQAELELGAKSKLTTSQLDAMSKSITTLSAETRVAQASLAGIKPGFSQLAATGTKDFFKGGGATSAAIFAPLIAGQIAEMMPKNTPTQRGAASAVTGLGNVASMAGTGFMLGGPWGAAAGGAIAALQEIPKAVVAFTSKLPELEAASSRAKDNLDEFNSRSATYVTAYDNYKAALDSGSASEQNLKKLRDTYGKALSAMSGGDIKRITAARASGGEEGERSEIASISEEKRLKSQSAEKNVELAKIRDEQKSLQTKRTIYTGLGAADALNSLQDSTGVKLPGFVNSAAQGIQNYRTTVGEFYGLGGMKRGDKESQKVGDILAQGSLANFGGDKQKELDFIKGIDLKSLRKVNTAEELGGMLTNQYKDKNGKVSEEDQSKIDQAVKIAEATGNANLVANEYADSLGRAYVADKKAIEALNERITMDKKAADQTAATASQIQKWIMALQKTSAIAQDNFKFGQESKQKTLEYNTKSASEDRTNQFQISEMIAGKSRTSITAEYKNKVKDIEGEGMAKQSDVIKDFLIKSSESANAEFNSAYSKEQKAPPAGGNPIINALTENTQRNFPYEGINLEKGDILQARLAATGEQNRNSQLQKEISNDTRIQSALKSGDIENLKGALVEHLVKLGSINQEQGNTLDQTRADAERQANDLANKLTDVKTATERQKQDAARGAIQSLTAEGVKSTMTSFGGYKGFMDNTSGGGVAAVGGALGAAMAEERSRKNIDSLVKNNLMRGTVDKDGNVVRDVKFDKDGNEVNYRAQVAGSGNLGRNYLKLNEDLTSILGTSAGGGDMSGYAGTRNAENAVIQDRTNDLDRKANELMKQAGYFDKTPNSKGPTDAQKMVRERLSEYINNATGGPAQDYSKLGADEIRKALNTANKTKATIETAQAFNDYGLAETVGADVRKNFGGDMEAKRQEKALSDYFQGNGNKAEQEAAQSLKDIHAVLSGGKGAASSIGTYGLVRPGEERNAPSALGGKGLVDVDDQRRAPAAPSQTYLNPDAKGGLYKPAGSGDMGQKNKQQQQEQEAAGGNFGGGNVTVAAPQINITVNGGAGGADELQRNVNSLVPELKASIEMVVKETFERRINSLEGRMDRVAMGNQAAKPIPLGVDKSSATT
jgi:TP901 family phage tail tape measure protein